MKKNLLILTLTLVISLTLVPAACFASTNWASVHGDVAHTGYSTSEAPDTNNVAWVSGDIGANLSSSVLVVDGKVFVYCSGNDMSSTPTPAYMKCLSEADGSLLWSTADGAIEGAEWGSWSSPAYDNGKVFVGSGSTAYCLDAGSGAVLWSYEMTYDVVNASPCAVDGKVVFGEWDPGHGNLCHYYCLNQNDGTLKWQFEVAGDIQGTAAYADGKFYGTAWQWYGEDVDHVYCIDTETGAQIWHQEGLTYDTCGTVSVAAGKVFVTTYNFYDCGELAALDAEDGHILWGGPEAPVAIQRTDSCPSYHDGKLYVSGGCVGFSDQYTYCFDANTGAKIWEVSGAGNWTCSPAVADGKVFVGKPYGFFAYNATYALNAATGALVWSADSGGSTPAVADGKVFTIDESGKVYAFGESGGAAPWDVNGDGLVNVLDMILVGQHFGESGSPGWINADVNGDGQVNVLDMIVIGQHWG
jgi:outer membrane protein assembly factor BamB